MFLNDLGPSFGISPIFIHQPSSQSTNPNFSLLHRVLSGDRSDSFITGSVSQKEHSAGSSNQNSEGVFPLSPDTDSNRLEAAADLQLHATPRLDGEWCGSQANPSIMVDHEGASPSFAAPHLCEDCGKSFVERCFLLRHRATHGAAKHVCPICNRAFVRDDKLKRHIRCLHSSERPYKCETCPKAFARKDKLQEHVRHHNRDITFSCPICPELFIMRSHLNRHLRGIHKIKLQSNGNQSVVQNLSQTTTNFPLSTKVISESKSAFTPVNNHFASGAMYNNCAGDHATSTFTSAMPNSGLDDLCPNIIRTKSGMKLTVNRDDTKRKKLDISPFPANVGSPCVPVCSSPAVPNVSNPSIEYNLPSNDRLKGLSADVSSQQHQTFDATFKALRYPPGPPLQSNFFPLPAYVSVEPNQHPRYPQLLDQRSTHEHQQMSAPSAWSAAMAASLLAPVNYVGWWSQPNSSIVLPNTPGIIINNLSTASENAPDAYVQSSCASRPVQMNATQSHCSSLASDTQCTSQSSDTFWGQRNESHTIPSVAAAASAQMFASLPPFAQAMYYRAASWAATQNSDAASNQWHTRQSNASSLYPTAIVADDS
ncbi:hypothetical protein CSKR_107373 [Clonorchis sinensis]|uniref:C2H2-type domain-containing protein n=1 Tax=Clonorchis sinensis TaxID=79923 RepID=A0A419PVF2_CLOSI|nr:hypothetical protein CSKR_107373 [Clonorchis sinensis]